MSRPYERWPDIWQFFLALHQDWRDDYPDEDAVITDSTNGWSDQELREALAQWHEAFDSADDADLSRIVGDFNPSYDPTEKFGNDRGWANWVREHLEAELGRRKADLSDAGDPR